MDKHESDSNYLHKGECFNPDCGSSDANAYYDDGHWFCFSCQTYTPPGDDTFVIAPDTKLSDPRLINGSYSALPARKLTEETCRKFGYQIGHHKGQPVQIANYRDASGAVVAQKLRDADKNFSVVGDGKKMTLFGMHLWNKGRKLVVTEGEIDAMTVSQMQGHKWATVSVPSGASSAKKALLQNWDYLNNFDEIILLFDSDDAGQKGAHECAEALPIGKCKIGLLPLKDPNQCLIEGQGSAVIAAIHQARDYRPDGIVAAAELRDDICVDDAAGSIAYPYSRLTEITKGLRLGELVTLTAGSGVGKSTLVREIAYDLHMKGEKLGMIMLEESNKRTVLGLVGIHLNKNIVVDRSMADEDEIVNGFDDLFQDQRNIYLYDHFGSSDVDVICNRIQYMVNAFGVKWVVLDHISILVSGLATTDERKLIDMAMTRLRTLVQQLDIGLILVSHLRRPEGDRGHEDGSTVRLGQLRGSHAVAQLSDICIGLQVDPENPDGDMRRLVVLKNRFTGEVGSAGLVTFHRDTGRLIQADAKF